jgi:hypothetical protein
MAPRPIASKTRLALWLVTILLLAGIRFAIASAPVNVFTIISVILTTVAAIQSSVRFSQRIASETSVLQIWDINLSADGVWVVWSLAAFGFWAQAAAGQQPWIIWLVATNHIGLFVVMGRQRPYARRFVVQMLFAIASVSLLIFLTQAQPHVGGPDFFYYICYARDMVRTPAEVSPNAYCYFPGGYSFWSVVWRWTDGELASLQWTVVSVLLLNGVLIFGVVYRHIKRYAWAAYAGLYYLLAAFRFEGLEGTTEPIATLWFLAALLIWDGRPLKIRDHRWIAVGLLLGCTVWTKQQAGLLCLGAAAWAVNRGAPPEQRHDWAAIAAIPIVAAFSLWMLILREGQGTAPLIAGLSQTQSYVAEGSLAQNLWSQIRNDESIFLWMFTSTFMSVFWAVAVTRRKRRWTRQCELGLFCTLAALFTLVQFRSRPYAHYFLLALPALAIATAMTGRYLQLIWLSPIPHKTAANSGDIPPQSTGRSSRDTRWAIGCAWLLLPFFYTGGNPAQWQAWNPNHRYTIEPTTVISPEFRLSIELATQDFAANERVFVVPPILSGATHYYLGSKGDLERGYTFRWLETPHGFNWNQFSAVLLIDFELESVGPDGTEKKITEIAHALEAAKFTPQRMGRVTIYRQTPLHIPASRKRE